MGILDDKTRTLVTATHYHIGNKFTPSNPDSYYDIRDSGPTNQKNFSIPMASAGVIDMGLMLNHTLTAGGASVDMWVQLFAMVDMSAVGGSATTSGVLLYSSTAGNDDLPTNGKFSYLPETGPLTVPGAAAKSFGIPELRQPIAGVRLYVSARTTPDAGSFNFRVTRRF